MLSANAISVRPLAQEDRADWQAMWTAYLDFYESSVDAPVYDATFARLLGDDPRDFNALVAEVDGLLSG